MIRPFRKNSCIQIATVYVSFPDILVSTYNSSITKQPPENYYVEKSNSQDDESHRPLTRQRAFWPPSVPGCVLPGSWDVEGPPALCWYWALRSALVKGWEVSGNGDLEISSAIMFCKGWVSTLSMFRTGVGTGTFRPATKRSNPRLYIDRLVLHANSKSDMNCILLFIYALYLPTSLLNYKINYPIFFDSVLPKGSPCLGTSMPPFFPEVQFFGLSASPPKDIRVLKSIGLQHSLISQCLGRIGRKQFWKQHINWTSVMG